MFVLAQLDDVGLSKSEFRIFGHLVRRAGDDGLSYDSLHTISGIVFIRTRAIRYILRRLEKRNAILPIRRPGHTTAYRINHDIASWTPLAADRRKADASTKQFEHAINAGELAQDAAKGVQDDGNGLPGVKRRRIGAALEREFMDTLKTLLGDDEMRRNGGFWRTLLRENPDKMERCMADVSEVLKSRPDEIQTTPAQYLQSLWSTFK